MEKLAQAKSYQCFRHEEETLCLKSTSLWLLAGDKNTTYFHRQFHLRTSRNHIAEITSSEGVSIQGQRDLLQAANSHFHQLFTEDGVSNNAVKIDILSFIPSLVSAEINSGLTKPFSEQDVVEFIWGMEPDKALGPYGFSIHFFRICWPVIKYDLVRMISSFPRKAKVGSWTNSTFLALIPKEVNPASFDRFRPISLCNASYKILDKLLANR